VGDGVGVGDGTGSGVGPGSGGGTGFVASAIHRAMYSLPFFSIARKNRSARLSKIF
jgi:hypothetical protein